jgi:hypothetical protein
MLRNCACEEVIKSIEGQATYSNVFIFYKQSYKNHISCTKINKSSNFTISNIRTKVFPASKMYTASIVYLYVYSCRNAINKYKRLASLENACSGTHTQVDSQCYIYYITNNLTALFDDCLRRQIADLAAGGWNVFLLSLLTLTLSSTLMEQVFSGE